MDIFINTLVTSLSEIAVAIIIGLLGIAGTWACTKIGKNQNLQNINDATQQVIDAAQTTALALQQSFVTDWKAAQNGKLTAEQIDELQDKAIEITLANLADPTVKLLEAAKVDVISLIMAQTEKCIYQMKEN